MTLSIIIVSYNTKELLEQCLESIVKSLTNSNSETNRHPDENQDHPNGSKTILNQVQNDDSGKSVKNKASNISYEIIVVDNNSTDGTREYLKQLTVKSPTREPEQEFGSGLPCTQRGTRAKLKVHPPKLTTRLPGTIRTRLVERNRRVAEGKNSKLAVKVILNEENTGFAKANNQGIKIAKGKYILLLNSDTIILDNTLKILVDYLEKHQDVAAISPLLLNPDHTPQLEYFMKFPNLWQIFFYHNRILRPFCKFVPGLKNKIYVFPKNEPFETEQLPGAALMVRKETFEKVGLLDEDYPFFYEDVDWCYRAKTLNQKLIMIPQAKIIHLKGGSWKKERKQDARFYQSVFNSLLLFVRKNYGVKEEKIFKQAIKLNLDLKGLIKKITLFQQRQKFQKE